MNTKVSWILFDFQIQRYIKEKHIQLGDLNSTWRLEFNFATWIQLDRMITMVIIDQIHSGAMNTMVFIDQIHLGTMNTMQAMQIRQM